MDALLHHIFSAVIRLGFAGPFILGILDSSFFFFPFGNDLLLINLIARNHGKIYLYPLSAALGSSIGVLLLDLVARKGGEQGLKKLLSPKRFEYITKKIRGRAGAAVAIACLAPPPFPFTPVIAAASAFQYPRQSLLAITLAARIVRFFLIALAAIWLGRKILGIGRSPVFTWFMVSFTVSCLVGSIFSVVRWSRTR